MKNMNEEIRQCGIISIHETERGHEMGYVFPPTFSGFQGHFPQNPVLPAIVQLMTARESIVEHLGRDLLITKVTRAKFQKIITPDIPVTVVWTLREQEDDFICRCILETEGTPASSFIMTLKAKSD
jgi:3-hydroxyacyl-[acyl-carrier-protein] dehydratase